MTTPDERRAKVLAALVGAGRNGVSGQTLAESLGCSRAAIHRAVEALRRAGTAIDGVHEGYRLAPDADPVSPLRAAEQLADTRMGPVIWTAETDSTNDDCVAAAREGAAEGLVIGSDHQRKGRGRRGRSWLDTPGTAVSFSVLLRPEVDLAGAGILPLVAAVAAAEAISDDAGIVWPNDVVIGTRKVCGILCEVGADESGVSWLVAGIGINVSAAPAVPDARWTPGSLADTGSLVSRQDLVERVLRRLDHHYQRWITDGSAPIIDAFAARDRLAGSIVEVTAGSRQVTGTVVGLDDNGGLRLRTGFGEETLNVGEVTRVHHGFNTDRNPGSH